MQQALGASRHYLRTRVVHHGCTSFRRSVLAPGLQIARRNLSDAVTRANESQHALYPITSATPLVRASRPLNSLPLICPGCGAPSQDVDASSAGYFGEKSSRDRGERKKQLDAIFAAAMSRMPRDDESPILDSKPEAVASPVCDRCHGLVHKGAGRSIIHPTTESIRAIIEESPHHRNHIYHILDAADFPMSLIPNLTSALHLPKLRTQNRRSKSMRYTRDRVAEISFIITRSDLLAPKKEQVDKMMVYIQDVLRDALGRNSRNVRLGNVRLVSSKRGWWTKTLKEDIHERGGAGWMVGKVNVGKSALVEVVYPKGRMEKVNIAQLRAAAEEADGPSPRETNELSNVDKFEVDVAQDLASKLPEEPYQGHDLSPMMADDVLTAHGSTAIPPVNDIEAATLEQQTVDPAEVTEDETNAYFFDTSEGSLLPPAPVEVAYPTLPTVSALPGTTASPIRLPFGKGKGELIDLPGIERSQLDIHVVEERRKDLVMKHRIIPEQQTVKPGQSLLLGGLIRITPKTDDLVFLTYSFLPTALDPHVTSTEKAIAVQTGRLAETGEAYSGNVKSNATEAAKTTIASAGTFKLAYDITKVRAGPVTHKAAGKMKAINLPYIIYGIDILIEGVGWIEIVAQTRRKAVSASRAAYNPFDKVDTSDQSVVPEIEVFSPLGKFIGSRRPLNAWVNGGPKKTPVHARKARPRQSMSYQRRVAGGGAVQANF